MKRKPLSKETKLKISQSCKGRKSPSYWLGKKLSHDHKEKMTGENHSNWKGDNASYSAIHNWINNRLGKPNQCEICKTTQAARFEWANKDHKYKRNLDDWIRLCPSCHRNYDHGNLIINGEQLCQ